MARELNRKLCDTKGHQWAISVAPDFNADNIEDIILAAHEGLAKLIGYRLDGEECWRLPDNTELPSLKKQVSFFKKMDITGVSQEDFAATMQILIDKSRESKIGKAKVTEWEGKKIKEDPRGPYIDWAIPCHMCHKEILGTKRLSQSDGVITRSQMFQAFEPGVVQYRPGSKLRVCSTCAPKHLSPAEANLPFPTVEEVKVEALKEAVEAEKEVVKAKVTRRKEGLDELLELAKPGSDVDPMFLRGMVYGVLKTLKEKEI